MKRVVLLLLSVVFSTAIVLAEENVLQTIEIEPVKDTYNIVLVSDKAVDVKKTVQAPNKINLILKDIRASKTLNTVYNNVANVDTVMVEQQGNGVNIFFQAENAESATVTFDSVAIPVATAKTDKTASLKLNNPIESYAPIYKEEYSNSKTSNLYNKLKESSALSGLKETLDDDVPASDMPNKLISFGLVILFIVASIRLFRKREPERKIGLSQQLTGMDSQNYNPLPQQFINGYHNSQLSKPFTTVNYGINAYKSENRNPYETTPMQIHNPRLRNYQQPQHSSQNTAVQQTKERTMQNVAVQTLAKKTTAATTPNNTAMSTSNIDNIKFLESMTAIYEKSGRHDLARGLKASLSKNNINQ